MHSFRPLEVVLGRKMRLPAVINDPIRDRVLLCAGPHCEVCSSEGPYYSMSQETLDGFEGTILASTSQIVPFASPTTVATDLETAISTTDVATTTGVAERISTCVSSRDTSLVVESSTTPEIPIRSARVGKRTRDSICK